MSRTVQLWGNGIAHLEMVGSFAPQLGLRILLAYEFWESGVEKLRGSNWFADIQQDLLFPFSVIPAEISWQMATWFELAGAIAILFGFATRLFSASLMVLTIVAWAAVHAGNGYNVCDNGYKLPLIYLVMFAPLLFKGAGTFSLDFVIRKCLGLRKGVTHCLANR